MYSMLLCKLGNCILLGYTVVVSGYLFSPLFTRVASVLFKEFGVLPFSFH